MSKRKKASLQPGLFDQPAWEQEAAAIADCEAGGTYETPDGITWIKQPSLEEADEIEREYQAEFLGQQCKLDGRPARIKSGGPSLAIIEPVDIEQTEIYVPWDDVAEKFTSDDDMNFYAKETT